MISLYEGELQLYDRKNYDHTVSEFDDKLFNRDNITGACRMRRFTDGVPIANLSRVSVLAAFAIVRFRSLEPTRAESPTRFAASMVQRRGVYITRFIIVYPFLHEAFV